MKERNNLGNKERNEENMKAGRGEGIKEGGIKTSVFFTCMYAHTWPRRQISAKTVDAKKRKNVWQSELWSCCCGENVNKKK